MFINCDQFIEFQNAFYVSSIEMYYSLDLSRVWLQTICDMILCA
jgi:hypothetical protein